MKISLELIPRNEEGLLEQLDIYKSFSNEFQKINIPDLKRFSLRSWRARQLCLPFCSEVVPHLRAIDFDLHNLEPLTSIIKQFNLSEILIVQGDPPTDISSKVYPTSTLNLVRALRELIPELVIYGAFDPYRSSLKDELTYIKQKEELGVRGFFSQPFFDLRLMEVYADHIDPAKIFWGVSPVMSTGSKNYWQTTNRAIFPSQFAPTLAWNSDFFLEVLEFCRRRNSNCYLMPIRINLLQFLQKVFPLKTNLKS